MYVAVVVRKSRARSGRDDQSWAAFVEEDQETAIEQALAATERWGHGTTYKVLTGELTHEVQPRHRYKVVKLTELPSAEALDQDRTGY